MTIPCHRIAALTMIICFAGGTQSSAEDALRLGTTNIDSLGKVTVVTNSRPIIIDVTPRNLSASNFGLIEEGGPVIGSIDGSDVRNPASIFGTHGTRKLKKAPASPESGLSTTFFVRRVAEGTTDVKPETDRGEAIVDTWTDRVITNEVSGNEADSPVTTWTGSVY